ncbi:decarboxylase [Bosea sp. Tri-44]|uniref:Y4yA family PLP-dependent enzyme n=1 Tax=Bosea sp. Tri-44 TaxID=1972137 RepID=UPI00100E67BB|nr:Y4yA family PLP-dependent enzyme [Bosea sp. Tri-44]RXT56374.1 decarboxylase [Bosea sp. Tri-44]
MTALVLDDIRQSLRPRSWQPDTLPPILDPRINALIQDAPNTLFSLVEQYGSPLNIVWPDILQDNARRLAGVLQSSGVPFRIFYGAKVNKSPGLVEAAARAGIGIDISSPYELRDALHAGTPPELVCASGPAKTRDFQRELIRRKVLISVDSIEELQELDGLLAECSDGPARILLRYRPASATASRFGIGAVSFSKCLRLVAAQPGRFAFEGFHVHLSGYQYDGRVKAVAELIDFVREARALGLDPQLIDIGGGLPIQYVAAQVYDDYLAAQSDWHYRNGTIPKSFYPYGSRVDAAQWLELLLAAPCREGLALAELLKAEALTLAIEPGRSLADQAAVSVFRVNLVKALPGGTHVVFVEGSSFSACETWFASEFLVDPIHIARDGGAEAEVLPMRAFIAGHSCLDDDVVTNRLLTFHRRPKRGDLLLFANTGGYQMDLLENEFHRHPLPRRIRADRDAAGAVVFTPDDAME